MSQSKKTISETPDALVAVAYGSHTSGNKRLKQMALNELLDRFGIRVIFVRGEPQRGATS